MLGISGMSSTTKLNQFWETLCWRYQVCHVFLHKTSLRKHTVSDILNMSCTSPLNQSQETHCVGDIRYVMYFSTKPVLGNKLCWRYHVCHIHFHSNSLGKHTVLEISGMSCISPLNQSWETHYFGDILLHLILSLL